MIKQVKDYLPQIQQVFPSLTESEIRKILNYGFRVYGYVNNRGGDVLIKSDSSKNEKITAMTGYLTYDSLKHYIRGLFKWRIKERVLYGLRNTEWDGYYYFGMMDEKHDILLDQLNNNRKKYVLMNHVFCYKAPKEIYHDHAIDHVYKFKYPIEAGFKIYFKNFKELKTNIEYVGINKESTWYRNLQTPSQTD